MTLSKTNISSKKIQEYLTAKMGLSRNQKGYFYLTCFLTEYLECPGPLVLQDFYESLKEQKVITGEYNDIYQRCLYTLKKSNNKEVTAMGVKDFLYHAFDELTHEES